MLRLATFCWLTALGRQWLRAAAERIEAIKGDYGDSARQGAHGYQPPPFVRNSRKYTACSEIMLAMGI
jgi:hypothetical protein